MDTWTSATAFILYLPVTHFVSITHPENKKGEKTGEKEACYNWP